MSGAAQPILLAAFILATSVWLGGYVAIAVVARVAAVTLTSAARVALFRALGRTFLRVGVPALVIALGTGAILLHRHRLDALLAVTVVIAVALVAVLVVAVGQARRMTRLRRRALDWPEDEGLTTLVHRDARVAAALRTLLALLSLTLVILGSVLAT